MKRVAVLLKLSHEYIKIPPQSSYFVPGRGVHANREIIGDSRCKISHKLLDRFRDGGTDPKGNNQYDGKRQKRNKEDDLTQMFEGFIKLVCISGRGYDPVDFRNIVQNNDFFAGLLFCGILPFVNKLADLLLDDALG